MNKTLIYFKTQLCSKSYVCEAAFTNKEVNNEWNFDFLQNTNGVQKVSWQKLFVPIKKLTMTETFIYFKIQTLLKILKLKLYLPIKK